MSNELTKWNLNDEVEMKITKEKKPRDTWENTRETFLSALGAIVGLGNLWRFPYMTYKYGGGAFLIPYTIFVICCGFPMFFLETSLGQYTRQSAFKAWNIAPIMKGVGLGSAVLSLFSCVYYIVIMAWCVCYFVQTFRATELPWMRCDNWYNTNSCITYKAAVSNNLTSFSAENSSLPIVEFWNNFILRKSKGIDDYGHLDNWPLVLSLLFSWILVYFCVFRGTKSTGKVVYFSSIFPYIMLMVLLVRGCTLSGSSTGIKFYLKPNITELTRPEVWVYAGSQVCYSYAICLTISIAFGSFSKFNSDCYRRTFYLSISCSMTSFIGGFAVFAVLGNMAEVMKTDIKVVVQSG